MLARSARCSRSNQADPAGGDMGTAGVFKVLVLESCCHCRRWTCRRRSPRGGVDSSTTSVSSSRFPSRQREGKRAQRDMVGCGSCAPGVEPRAPLVPAPDHLRGASPSRRTTPCRGPRVRILRFGDRAVHPRGCRRTSMATRRTASRCRRRLRSPFCWCCWRCCCRGRIDTWWRSLSRHAFALTRTWRR